MEDANFDNAALRQSIERAFADILHHLGAEVLEPDFDNLRRYWKSIISKNGRAILQEKLGLSEPAFNKFDKAIAEVARRNVENAEKTSSERNICLAHLRLADWLGGISPSIGGGKIEWPLPRTSSQFDASERVRALELILRALINESYRTQETLLARLMSTFKPEVVERWLQLAANDDVMSGLTFSELSSFFVCKQEFVRYESVYSNTEFLHLLRDRRKTLQDFLDSVRSIRNTLAHHRDPTPVQMALLSLYYDEIVSPVKQAFSNGQTDIDPQEYLSPSHEELREFTEALAVDLREVEDDISQMQQALAATKRRVSVLEGSLLFLFGSLAVFILNYILLAISTPKDVAGQFSGEFMYSVARYTRGNMVAGITFGIGLLIIALNIIARSEFRSKLSLPSLDPQKKRLATSVYVVTAFLFYAIPSYIGASDGRAADEKLAEQGKIRREVFQAISERKNKDEKRRQDKKRVSAVEKELKPYIQAIGQYQYGNTDTVPQSYVTCDDIILLRDYKPHYKNVDLTNVKGVGLYKVAAEANCQSVVEEIIVLTLSSPQREKFLNLESLYRLLGENTSGIIKKMDLTFAARRKLIDGQFDNPLIIAVKNRNHRFLLGVNYFGLFASIILAGHITSP